MKKIVRIIILVAVFGLIFVALITSSIKKPELSKEIWNNSMVLGDTENAVRHYVVYTDLMCPYCNFYAKTIMDNEEEFNNYISDHKIAYEVRVTDMLYEGSGVEMSRPAAEGAYCAAKENRFWDYYHTAVNSLFENYYSKGLGNSKTAPKITGMSREYWKEIGKKSGLGENFEKCFNNKESLAEVSDNTMKASSTAAGMPFFVFGKYSTGGFDSAWGWSEVEQMFNAGLK